jgi:hypothetical protein
MSSNDPEYYRQRAIEERELAMVSAQHNVAEIHLSSRGGIKRSWTRLSCDKRFCLQNGYQASELNVGFPPVAYIGELQTAISVRQRRTPSRAMRSTRER